MSRVSFIYALLPRRCAFCGRVINASREICYDCDENAPRILPPFCTKCGRNKAECVCGGRERFFACIAAPYYFDGVVRRGIHRFKFRSAKHSAECYCRMMAQCAAERYKDVAFDCVLCVPMTKKRKKERGFNQSELLASGVAAILGVNFVRGGLVKLYETHSQHGLSRLMRRGNLSGVFDVGSGFNPAGKVILLCDDVSTSGETLDECAKMLYLRGAQEIHCLALALTKFKNKDIIH